VCFLRNRIAKRSKKTSKSERQRGLIVQWPENLSVQRERTVTGLAERILEGDEKSGARLITLIEDKKKEGYVELTRLLPHTGKAHILGITGPAGAGKSTLIAKLAGSIRSKGIKLGIIAIDPTSMQTRGAFLGDRVRMNEIEYPKEIFIRSMADREHPGGIARAALGAVYVMEALGKDVIIVESVGAGQSDKALFYICDTVVTLFTPEFGDELQLLKAGLLELGDVVVVNKWDKANPDEDLVGAIRASMPEKEKTAWPVPILRAKADIGEGIDEFAKAIEARWNFLLNDKTAMTRRREKIALFIMTLLKEEIWQRFFDNVWMEAGCAGIIEEARSRIIDPYSAVERIASIVEQRLQIKAGVDCPDGT
jgi:LAO/AO transport system kinase